MSQPRQRTAQTQARGNETVQKPAPVVPANETVQETLARSRWRKTQPPKSPLSGGLSTQFPPDKGG